MQTGLEPASLASKASASSSEMLRLLFFVFLQPRSVLKDLKKEFKKATFSTSEATSPSVANYNSRFALMVISCRVNCLQVIIIRGPSVHAPGPSAHGLLPSWGGLDS